MPNARTSCGCRSRTPIRSTAATAILSLARRRSTDSPPRAPATPGLRHRRRLCPGPVCGHHGHVPDRHRDPPHAHHPREPSRSRAAHALLRAAAAPRPVLHRVPARRGLVLHQQRQDRLPVRHPAQRVGRLLRRRPLRNRPEPDQPFFAVFNPTDTHESGMWPGMVDEITFDPAAVVVPPTFPDTPIVRETLAQMYTQIEIVDRRFGELLDQLDEDGLADKHHRRALVGPRAPATGEALALRLGHPRPDDRPLARSRSRRGGRRAPGEHHGPRALDVVRVRPSHPSASPRSGLPGTAGRRAPAVRPCRPRPPRQCL